MLHSARTAGTSESPGPAAVKGEVRRERLLSRLTAAMDGPWTLTLVSAPAGTVYQRVGASCIAHTASATVNYYAVTGQLPPSAFVEMTAKTE